MDNLVAFFLQLEPQHWLALAFLLLIAEMMSGTSYLLWPAVAAGLTGLAAFAPAVGWQTQWLLFAGLTIGLTLLGRPLRAQLMRRYQNAPALNERAIDLVGQRGAAAGAFVDGMGTVRINDSVWRAKSADAVEAGAAVQVLSVEGATLTVKLAA